MPSSFASRRSTTRGRRSTSCAISATVLPSRNARRMRAEQGASALGLVRTELTAICRALMNVVAGARGQALLEDLRTTVGGTPSEIVWQALYADCLRVVHSAVMADGVIEDREIEALFDII